MMIWVHGFLMPERGETETRIFFLMGTDPRIDGSIDRQNNRNKKAGLKARKKIQFSDLQSPLCATKLMRAGRWWGWRSADTAYPALGSFPASCYHCRCLGFQGPKDCNSTTPCSVRHLAFRLPFPARVRTENRSAQCQGWSWCWGSQSRAAWCSPESDCSVNWSQAQLCLGFRLASQIQGVFAELWTRSAG